MAQSTAFQTGPGPQRLPASLRDRLVSEIAALDAAESAIEWAGQSIDAKNTLDNEDAVIVEAAFRDRMRMLQPEIYPPDSVPPQKADPAVESRAGLRTDQFCHSCDLGTCAGANGSSDDITRFRHAP